MSSSRKTEGAGDGASRWAIAMLVALACTGAVRAADDEGKRADRPRLVLLIVVDQLRADLVTRFDEHFVDGGFRRLKRHGAHFTNAHFSYLSSATAPGHATISTGALPRHHGIVANDWFLQSGVPESQPAVGDLEARVVGPPGEPAKGRSPRNLLSASLGDQMRLADRRSRVFSVGLKDRATILLGGRGADGAFWWSESTGRFVTSTYYATGLPAFVQAFNDERPADRYSGQTWDRLLPAEAYAGAWPLEESWSPVLSEVGAAFPHKLPDLDPAAPNRYYVALFGTPFANELVFDLARRAIAAEKLGADASPDLLCLALSANDLIGHTFGPESAEVMDATIRTDRQLAQFLDFIDERVGLRNCVVALTADHGVTSNPRVVEKVRLDGGFFEPRALIEGLDRVLKDAAGNQVSGDRLVLGFKLPWIYCDPSLARLDAELGGRLGRAGVEFLRGQKGVADAYCGAELSGLPPAPDDRDRTLAWRCYHPERSGYFCLKLAPFHHVKGGDIAGHGAGYRSDRHVPILLMGSGVRAGRYAAPADPMDIAVTIADLLGIEPPDGAEGRVLHEAIGGGQVGR